MKKFKSLWIALVILLSTLVVTSCTTTKHTVTFMLSADDKVPITQTVNDKETIKNFTPTLSDYQFEYWCLDPELNQKYDVTKPVTGDFTLYARWKEKVVVTQSTLKFSSAGGTGAQITDIVANNGSEINLPSADQLNRDGHVFSGWSDGTTIYSAGSKYTVEKNITFAAVWERAINATFNYGTEDDNLVKQVKINTTFVLPTIGNITKENYTFAGWLYNNQLYQANENLAVGTYDIELHAAWAGTYRLTFDLEGGNGVANPIDGTSLSNVNLPAVPTKAGYTFDGWSDGQNTYAAGSQYQIMYSDMELVAEWTVLGHRVQFADWDGTVIDTQLVQDGESAVAPSHPVINVPEFTGWSVSLDNITKATVIIAQYNYQPTNMSMYKFDLTSNYTTYSIYPKTKIGMTTEIYLPHSYQGKLVTHLLDFSGLPANTLDEGFFQSTILTSIHFPSTYEHIGAQSFFNCGALQNVYFASESQLKSIGSSAFYSCSSIMNFNFPDSLVSIGESAFKGCIELEEVVFSANSNLKTLGGSAFSSCAKLANVVLPNSLETIGNSAFQDDNMLEEIVIPQNVKVIGSGAFFMCKNLNSVIFNTSILTTIDDRAFYATSIATITIPASVLRIGKNAFYQSLLLTEVQFGGNPKLTIIAEGAFGNCPILAKFNSSISGTFVIPKAVTTIETLAFVFAREMQVVEFEANSLLNTIGDAAFASTHPLYEPTDIRTNKLISFTIPKLVTSFGAAVFNGCEFLEEIIVEEGNTIFKVEERCLLSADGKILYTYPIACSATTLNIPEGVEVILEKVFFQNKYLQHIVMPNTITMIGDACFQQAQSLKSVVISNKLEILPEAAFYECMMLENVIINADSILREIEADVFLRCNMLNGITLPATLEKIGAYAFSGCGALAYVDFAVDSILSEIGEGAFYCGFGVVEYYNYVLTTMTIPATVTTIGAFAFGNLVGIEEVIFASGTELQYIGASAFANSGLESIIIPATVVEIGSFAFSTSSLTNVEFAENTQLTVLSHGIFMETSIETIDVPAEITVYNDYCFSRSTLTSFVMPNTVVEIGKYVFYDCYELISVTFSDNVRVLPIHTISFASKLTTVNLPSKLTEIHNYAFYSCVELESITIPSLVTLIGLSAFSGCTSLKTVTVLANSAPSFASNTDKDTPATDTQVATVFADCPLENIYVKSVYVGLYKQKWSKYAMYVVAMEE